MLDIKKACDDARYSENLQQVISKLRGEEILRLSYESDYQGDVDIDVLLSDGRVFSYNYNYGSCSGCDEWESRGLSDNEIEATMLSEATIFDSRKQYDKWRKTI